MGVEFRLLGPVEVRAGGSLVDIGHQRRISVLAALLLEPNSVVSIDQLLDRVWGERVPSSAHNTLYGYVYRLRRVLADLPGVDIARRSGGYVLSADTATIDVFRFRELADTARDTEDDERRFALLDEATALWRGGALGSLSTPWFDAASRRLEQERVRAEGDRAEAALRLGRQREVVGALSELTEADPLDERLAGLLMRALHLSGRQADALHRYELVRRRLADELGTEPCAALRELHLQILTGEPDVAAPASAPPVPRQLPASPRKFTARRAELVSLDKAMEPDDTVNVLVVDGPGGVGKTWLALKWAHRAVDRFPDGQLYVNLRGFDRTGDPVAPQSVLSGFLDALGVDLAGAPRDPAALGALYRSVVADRRLLILLDNAKDVAQVVPLLPGGSACTVLITSRDRLAGLSVAHGARTVTLRPMDPDEGTEVFVEHLGHDRVAAEPEAVEALRLACSGLPLAMGIMASRAAAYPDLPLAALAGELTNDPARLAAFDTGDPDFGLVAVFATSYRALTPRAAELFALIGSAPGPDIGHAAAAVLTGLPTGETRLVLRELERLHLVHQYVPGRYRMHDLVRLFAAEQGSAEERTAGLRRLLDALVSTAHTADRLLNPAHEPLDLGLPAPTFANAPHDRQSARTWFDEELPCLLAAQHVASERGWDHTVWQLTCVLDGSLWRRGHLTHHVTVWRAGLASALRLGDAKDQIRAHRRLGHAYVRAGAYADALEHLNLALTSAQEAGDIVEQARIHDVWAVLSSAQRDYHEALAHSQNMLDLYTSAGLPPRVANALNTVGWYHAQLGEYDLAAHSCEQALALHREHGDLDGVACTLDSLGFIASQEGRFSDAAEHYQASLTVFHDIGNTYEEANSLVNLGDVRDAAGQRGDALVAWRKALDLYRAQRRTADADRVERKLLGEG